MIAYYLNNDPAFNSLRILYEYIWKYLSDIWKNLNLFSMAPKPKLTLRRLIGSPSIVSYLLR